MFEIQINKLMFIIENWSLARDNPKEMARVFKLKFDDSDFDISSGLCDNCDLNLLDLPLIEDLFYSFNESVFTCPIFPLRNFENYLEMENYTETPERLELAKHCLEYLTSLRRKCL